MKEVIILEVSGNKSQLVQDFLKQKKVDYRILIENQLELHNNSKKREKEKQQLKKGGGKLYDILKSKEVDLW